MIRLPTDLPELHAMIAVELERRYREVSAPEGLSGVLAWHWEQAGNWRQATEASLMCAEELIQRRDGTRAQRWCERALEYQERLPREERGDLELRALLLAWTVLDFGGQHREALEYARRLYKLAEAQDAPEMRITALLALGRTHRALGSMQAAETELLRTIDLARLHNLPSLEADALFHLGKLRQLQGKHFEAIQHFTYAQAQDAALEDQARMAQVFTGLGDVYRALGAPREALNYYTRALQLEHSLPGVLGAAILQEKLALCYIDLARPQEALDAEQESLRLRQSINDRVGIGRAHSVLGSILARTGDHEHALEHYNQALEVEQTLQGVRGLGMIYSHIGDSYRALGDYARASNAYQQSLSIAQQQDDKIGLALGHERLGNLAREWNDRATAGYHYQEALHIRQQLGHSDEVHRLQRQIDKLLEDQMM